MFIDMNYELFEIANSDFETEELIKDFSKIRARGEDPRDYIEEVLSNHRVDINDLRFEDIKRLQKFLND